MLNGDVSKYNHYCEAHISTFWFQDKVAFALRSGGIGKYLPHSAESHTEGVHRLLGEEPGYNEELLVKWIPFMEACCPNPESPSSSSLTD